ncbi:MAG: cysteine desulfurase [Hyphomicrobiaceae bacterium]|nr:cysteine desulfurase [Hyphomicrobiaceae bacterium]
MTQTRTYLDYNATAPLRPDARTAMIAALDLKGNASSVHAEGREARQVIEAARVAVAQLVGARAADVVFTSGATEANAWVAAGGWRRIYLSGLEHDSVRAPAAASGAEIVQLPVKSEGVIDVAAVAALLADAQPLADGRALMCVQAANNETGVIQPVAELAALARAYGIAVQSDAVQAAGRIALDCAVLGIDFLSISAHKIGGPKGMGALVLRDGAALKPLVRGGGQERGRRGGTENVAAIAGFGAAARAALNDLELQSAIAARRDGLASALRAQTPELVVIGAGADRLANTLCVALPGHAAETLVIRLDLAGVAISAGSACSSGKVGVSATLAAMKLPDEIAKGAVRLSLGSDTTDDDIRRAVNAWRDSTVGARRAA